MQYIGTKSTQISAECSISAQEAHRLALNAALWCCETGCVGGKDATISALYKIYIMVEKLAAEEMIFARGQATLGFATSK